MGEPYRMGEPCLLHDALSLGRQGCQQLLGLQRVVQPLALLYLLRAVVKQWRLCGGGCRFSCAQGLESRGNPCLW